MGGKTTKHNEIDEAARAFFVDCGTQPKSVEFDDLDPGMQARWKQIARCHLERSADAVRKHQRLIGRSGGMSGVGAAKARSSEQAAAAGRLGGLASARARKKGRKA